MAMDESLSCSARIFSERVLADIRWRFAMEVIVRASEREKRESMRVETARKSQIVSGCGEADTSSFRYGAVEEWE